MVTQIEIQRYRASLRGSLLEPDDKGYEDARNVYNGMIDKHPRLIAQCVDAADIIRSVNFARENQILLAVRGGGHSVGGHGTCDDGLVIDLSKINYTRIDPIEKTIVVGGGCTLGDADHASHVFGMATPSGIFSLTGVGGLTTGGGFGYFTRKYGLSIDNLLEVDMVLADGSFVKADENQNADLFWAVRGGSGNFGIVTAFKFRLFPIDTIYAGPIFYDISEAKDIMKWYRNLILAASDDLYGFFAFLTIPPVAPFPEHLHYKKVCGVFWVYTGPHDNAENTFKDIRSFNSPLIDLVGPIPHPVLQSMFDNLIPKGYQHYWRADFVNELSDAAIDEHVRFGNKLPTPLSSMHLYPVNGAASRVSSSATAWNYRDASWNMIILGVDPDPANNEKIINWTKKYWEALHPFSAGGSYVNFLGDEGESRIKAAYGKNYERLVEIKTRYDPGNLFRLNQNIKPTINLLTGTMEKVGEELI